MARPKGIANKKTDYFFDACGKLKHDPVEFNIRVAQNDWKSLGYEERTYTVHTKSGGSYEQDYITVADRITANNKLLDFMFPKRKAIELTSPADEKDGVIFMAYDPKKLKPAP